MKIASKLLTTAFVAVAIASTALPMARPAEAASGPDLVAIIEPKNFSGGSGFGFTVTAYVTNSGDTKSAPAPTFMTCGYLPAPHNGRLVEWIATANPSSQVMPALDPKGVKSIFFSCPVNNGRVPVAARIVVQTNPGETNTANNKAAAWYFKLD